MRCPVNTHQRSALDPGATLNGNYRKETRCLVLILQTGKLRPILTQWDSVLGLKCLLTTMLLHPTDWRLRVQPWLKSDLEGSLLSGPRFTLSVNWVFGNMFSKPPYPWQLTEMAEWENYRPLFLWGGYETPKWNVNKKKIKQHILKIHHNKGDLCLRRRDGSIFTSLLIKFTVLMDQMRKVLKRPSKWGPRWGWLLSSI